MCNVLVLHYIMFSNLFLQLFDRRNKYLRSKERKLWEQINAQYMSDEETDDESDGGFVIHKLEWRSRLLNQLVSRLDDRYEKSREESTIKRKIRAPRRTGSPSFRTAPRNAPRWALLNSSSDSPTSSAPHTPDHEIPAYNISPPSLHTSTPTSSTSPNLPLLTTTPLSSGVLTASARVLNYCGEAQSDDEYSDDEEFGEMIRSAINSTNKT